MNLHAYLSGVCNIYIYIHTHILCIRVQIFAAHQVHIHDAMIQHVAMFQHASICM
jgi:hypothetical protein